MESPPPDIPAWRVEQRRRLLTLRRQLTPSRRADGERRIMGFLSEYFSAPAGRIIAGYWPIQGEPDLRPWFAEMHQLGAVCALPVVVKSGEPLEFHRWVPSGMMKTVAMGISVPADGVTVCPDVIIVPMIGFDADRHRLGFGGGFYDRTLTSVGKDVATIGIAFSECGLPSIYPQPHDVPMHAVVTDKGIL